MAKVIRIYPYGRLANQMFQYLLARILQSQVPDATITGLSLSQFGLLDENSEGLAETEPGAHIITINEHVFPFGKTIRELRREPKIEVRIQSLTARMEYLAGQAGLARRVFPIDPRLGTGFDGRHLVISIRADDILRGKRLDYTVLPIAWYRHLVEHSGLEPVFIGQIGDDRYSKALRESFPRAQFIRHEDPLEDFNRLRTSANVVLSTSTFCWIAVWMSETARRVHMPIIGIYNRVDRPDIDLLPIHDRRYQFYAFDTGVLDREAGDIEAKISDIEAKISGPAKFQSVHQPWFYRAKVALSQQWLRAERSRVSVWRDLRALIPRVT